MGITEDLIKQITDSRSYLQAARMRGKHHQVNSPGSDPTSTPCYLWDLGQVTFSFTK